MNQTRFQYKISPPKVARIAGKGLLTPHPDEPLAVFLLCTMRTI
jgi:hypothetical protein